MKSKTLAYVITFAFAAFAVPATQVQLRGSAGQVTTADLPFPGPPGRSGIIADLPYPGPPRGGVVIADLPYPGPPRVGVLAS